MKPTIILPEGFPPPRGYANGAVASGDILYIGGQIGWDGDAEIVSDDFVAQFARALDNVLAVVTTAGGEPTDVADMTIYVTDLDAYRARARELRDVWQPRFGDHYPAMALLGISGLVHPRAQVEIQAVAHIGPGERS